jgi:hypothetical protein
MQPFDSIEGENTTRDRTSEFSAPAFPSPVQDAYGPQEYDTYSESRRFRRRSFSAITWSSNSRRQIPTQRSATPFCQGLRTDVCRHSIHGADRNRDLKSMFRIIINDGKLRDVD